VTGGVVGGKYDDLTLGHFPPNLISSYPSSNNETSSLGLGSELT
jgi:hypothetical protein